MTTTTRPAVYSVKDMARAPLWALMSKKDAHPILPAAKANYDAGQAFLLQAQRLDPNEQNYLEKLYLIAQSARGEFKQALVHDPNNPKIHAALGQAFNHLPSDAAKQGQYEAYKTAVDIEPHNPAYVYGLGISAMRLEYHEEAISLFQKAIGMKEEYAVAHDSLGALYNSLGDGENARFHYQKAIEYYQKDNKDGKNDVYIQALESILAKL
jgi:tetratricopeptide (TPR) repeat protein